MTFTKCKLSAAVGSLTLACCPISSFAVQEAHDIASFSLEDLMQMEVTSVAKKPQRLASVAAAVFVITAEDIRRSGANALPEVLRLAPGVDATRISGNRWAVSMRGFASRFSNKLLVLVDGRNIYNPAFSGVFWEDLQMPLEDIERIEVIRGPGSAVWGTNAVNGVINIITKSPAATQGGQAVVGAGNVEGAFGRLRWGGANADGSLFYRGYISTQSGEAQRAVGGGSGNDAYRQGGAGFRVDGYHGGAARWDLSGDLYDTRCDAFSMAQLPWVSAGAGVEKHHGGSLRGRYEKTLADGSSFQVQGAYARTTATVQGLTTDDRSTFDLGFQHRFRAAERHDLVWGVDYRQTADTLASTAFLAIDGPSKRLSYYSVFAQDEIGLTDSLHLTLGARFDHNPFTGWETLPSASVSWSLAPNQTLWGSAARTDRAPSRGERGLNVSNGSPVPPGATPYVIRFFGSSDVGNEQLRAYEAGLRSQWDPSLVTDVVAFTHHYDQLGIGGPATYVPSSDGTYVNVLVPLINGGKLTLDGVELAVDWRPNPALRFQLAYTHQEVAEVSAGSAAEAEQIPRQIASVRASWTPRADLNVDVWWRYTDDRPSPASSGAARKAFSSLDLRLAWKMRKSLELSLVGQNLNDGACRAYSGIANPVDGSLIMPTCMPRAVYGQVRWDF